jgi:hypothetical protein
MHVRKSALILTVGELDSSLVLYKRCFLPSAQPRPLPGSGLVVIVQCCGSAGLFCLCESFVFRRSMHSCVFYGYIIVTHSCVFDEFVVIRYCVIVLHSCVFDGFIVITHSCVFDGFVIVVVIRSGRVTWVRFL